MKYSDMIAFLEQANTTLTDLKISNELHFRIYRAPLEIVLYDHGIVRRHHCESFYDVAKYFNRFNNIARSHFCNIKNRDDLILLLNYLE